MNGLYPVIHVNPEMRDHGVTDVPATGEVASDVSFVFLAGLSPLSFPLIPGGGKASVQDHPRDEQPKKRAQGSQDIDRYSPKVPFNKGVSIAKSEVFEVLYYVFHDKRRLNGSLAPKVYKQTNKFKHHVRK